MQPIVHSLPVDVGLFDLAPSESKIAHVNVHFAGAFVLSATGSVTRVVSARRIGDTSDPGGDPLPTQSEPQLGWKLSDPDGHVLFQYHPPKPGADDTGQSYADISLAALDRVRDLAGFIRQPWRLEVTNEWPYQFGRLSLNAQLFEGIPSSSAPPLLDHAPVTLQAGVSQTVPFTFNRLGNIQVNMAVQPPNAIVVTELLDPSGSAIASGFDSLQYTVGLRELHQAQKNGSQWSLQLGSSLAATCQVTAQVYDTLTIPSAVLQNRLDAVLGADGKKLAISVEYDSTQDDSFVCLTINDSDVLELFDTISLLSSLEDQDRVLRTPKSQPPPPAPVDPPPAVTGTPYRIHELGPLSSDGHSFYLKNFQTDSIRITAGGPDDDLYGRLTVEIVFAGNPVVDIDGAPDLEISDFSCSFDLVVTWMQDTKHIALVPQNRALHFQYNWNDAPDFIVSAFQDPQSLIGGKFDEGLTSLTVFLKTFTEHLFFQFMGGLFDFTSIIQWKNRAFILPYIVAEEDPPGALNPFYHPGSILSENEEASTLARTTVTASTPKPNWQSPNLSKIDHIVVLMKENRSFDHVLGYLSLTGNRLDVDGLAPAIINSFPVGSQPRPFPLIPVTADAPPDFFPFDPDHDFDVVAQEIDNPGGPPMHGFIPQFVNQYPWLAWDSTRRANAVPPVAPEFMPFEPDAVMGYHTPVTVPYYDFLAQHFSVCDRWFSSHPGPTFPNRFFFLSGKLNTERSGEPQPDNVIAGLTFVRHRTLFDELTARSISWTYYESPPDVTMLRLYARYAFDDQNIRPINEFFTRARAGQLPSVTFIDPNFHYGQTNDDHPPTSITAGQTVMQEVVEALQANAAWNKTLLIFTYDEHGSLFDHVLPGTAETLKDNQPNSAPISVRYGVRVPAIIISPWVEAKCVHQVFDHCSILKTVIARFCPDDPPILSDRVAFATDVGPALSRTSLPLTATVPTGGQTQEVSSGSGASSGAGAATSAATGRSAQVDAALTSTLAAKRPDPLPRVAELFQPNADWHHFMARLTQLVRP